MGDDGKKIVRVIDAVPIYGCSLRQENRPRRAVVGTDVMRIDDLNRMIDLLEMLPTLGAGLVSIGEEAKRYAGMIG